MKTIPLPAGHVLAAGLVLGIVGDLLLRTGEAPGLNLLLWAIAVALAVVLLQVRTGCMISRESAMALAIGVLFAAGAAWRDSPALKLLGLGCVIAAFALPAFRAGAAWIRRSGVGGYIAALAGSAAHAMFGAALVMVEVDWSALRTEGSRRTKWGHAAAVARGTAIAIPFIIVFGALFISADEVFARVAADLVRVDMETLSSHAVLIGFFGWITTGYLRGFLTGTRMELPAPGARPALGITETGTVLALLDLLFLAFVIVQVRYLFGGSSLVEITPGLTYAEYARRGFFELAAVAALVLPLLLAADWLLRREGRRDEYIFRVLTGMQIALVLVITASALQRMRLYQEAYGLTEQRVYVTALLILMVVVLLWFTATVLRGRRQSFAFGALLAAFLTVAVLYVVNPDALIARTNIARVQSGATETQFDASYAASLSGDAVPVLLSALPTLPEDARCRIADRMLERWAADERLPLRNWSWSDAQARTAVRENEVVLRSLASCTAEPVGL